MLEDAHIVCKSLCVHNSTQNFGSLLMQALIAFQVLSFQISCDIVHVYEQDVSITQCILDRIRIVLRK
jgi:hypothetical protein